MEYAALENEEDMKDLKAEREYNRQLKRMEIEFERQRRLSEIRINEQKARAATAEEKLSIVETRAKIHSK